MEPSSDLLKDLAAAMKKEYNSLTSTDEAHMMQALESIVQLQWKKRDLRSILHDVAMIIHRTLPFREVSIGIKSPSDGLYRYIEALGIAPLAKNEHMKLKYTYEQMYDQQSYPYMRISKYTDFRYSDPEAGEKVVEKEAFSRPSLLSERRTSIHQMLEADYFDTYIFNQRGDLIGWIEVAQPKDGLIPPMRTIRWLEIFAIAIAPYLEQELEKMKISEFGKTLALSKD